MAQSCHLAKSNKCSGFGNSPCTAGQIEAVKLRRAEKVAHTTVDKDLGVLKAFFNWCMDRGLATTNPVCKVKFFHANNERVRYLTDDEWQRLREAAAKVESLSP